MRRGVTTLLFAMRMPKLSRLAGGRAPKGRRESHAHVNNHGRIHGQHKRVGKRGKSLMCMGYPSGPSGTSPARRRSFPADGQAMGSRALGHSESRIFAIDTGFLSKKHGCLAGKLFFFHRFFNRQWRLYKRLCCLYKRHWRFYRRHRRL